MTPSHQKEREVRPVMQIVKDLVAMYGWWATRWAIGWKNKDGPYIFAYMAFPRGYVLHHTDTVENEVTGARAQLIVFREESLADPRLKPVTEAGAMRQGGYL